MKTRGNKTTVMMRAKKGPAASNHAAGAGAQNWHPDGEWVDPLRVGIHEAVSHALGIKPRVAQETALRRDRRD